MRGIDRDDEFAGERVGIPDTDKCLRGFGGVGRDAREKARVRIIRLECAGNDFCGGNAVNGRARGHEDRYLLALRDEVAHFLFFGLRVHIVLFVAHHLVLSNSYVENPSPHAWLP